MYCCEIDTIKRIYVMDQGFLWYYEICNDPDAPEDFVIIKQIEDNETQGELRMPKDLINAFIKSLNVFKEVGE